MADVVAEVRERLPMLSENGPVDRLLALYGLSLEKVEGLLRLEYELGSDLKRDRLYVEIAALFQSGLLRIGEGLLQREKTDKLAGLLERLKDGEKRK